VKGKLESISHFVFLSIVEIRSEFVKENQHIEKERAKEMVPSKKWEAEDENERRKDERI